MIEDRVVRTARRFALTILLVSMASIAHAQGDLDRQRDAFCQVDKALDSIGLKPGMTVGQIGTDSGYLALKLAARVGPNGRVLPSLHRADPPATGPSGGGRSPSAEREERRFVLISE